jgi:hypothetical protein
MFISEEEADRRVNSKGNLLRRLGIPLRPPKEVIIVKDPAPEDEEVRGPELDVVREVDIALAEVQANPTEPTEDDAIRLAILAGRRHLKTSEERGGRYPQQGNVPPIFRALIGSAAKLGTATAAAKSWGVNSTMAHHYKHGRTSQDTESKGLSQQIDHNVMVVRSQVLDLLSTTVSNITPEKLENRNAQELSAIARNLSSIMSSTRPLVVNEQTNNAQVIVFSPDAEKETTYETIEVE